MVSVATCSTGQLRGKSRWLSPSIVSLYFCGRTPGRLIAPRMARLDALMSAVSVASLGEAAAGNPSHALRAGKVVRS